MHYSWIEIDQLDVTFFIISLFTAQHVSNVSTSIFNSLRLTVDIFRGLYCSVSMCVGVTVWFGWGGVVSLCRLKHCWVQPKIHEITQQISRKLLRMDVLTFETYWALNNEIIKQVTSSWSIFIQLLHYVNLVLWQLVVFLCVSRTVFRMSLVMDVRRMLCSVMTECFKL